MTTTDYPGSDPQEPAKLRRWHRGGARPVMPRPPEGLGRPMRLEEVLEEMERFRRRTRRQGQ